MLTKCYKTVKNIFEVFIFVPKLSYNMISPTAGY